MYPRLGMGNSISPTENGPVHIHNQKGANPYSQLERAIPNSELEKDRSIFSTRKGPVHIPNWKGANANPQLERGQTISPTGKCPVHIPI